MMKLPNSLLIELPYANTANVQFGDQPILRGKKILTLLPTSAGTSLTGQPVIDLTAGATLTLRTATSHDIHNGLPLSFLSASAKAGLPLQFGGQEIDWSKSFITVPAAGTGKVVQVSVIFE